MNSQIVNVSAQVIPSIAEVDLGKAPPIIDAVDEKEPVEIVSVVAASSPHRYLCLSSFAIIVEE